MSTEGTQQRRSSDVALESIRELIQVQADHAKERHDDLVERFDNMKEFVKPLVGIDLKQMHEDVQRHNKLEDRAGFAKKFLIWFIPIGTSLGLWNWKWLAAILHIKELGAQ